jgi:hypothetical protein
MQKQRVNSSGRFAQRWRRLCSRSELRQRRWIAGRKRIFRRAIDHVVWLRTTGDPKSASTGLDR